MSPLNSVKGVRNFLAHAGFYRRFIKDFSEIAKPLSLLIEYDRAFKFSKDCIEAFEKLKVELGSAPILVDLDLSLPCELMFDAKNYAVGAFWVKERIECSTLYFMLPRP